MSDHSQVPDGWTSLEGGGWVEAVHRRYPDGEAVTVWIRQNGGAYEVRETVDSPVSGQKQSAVGGQESLAGARELMVKTCRDWDNWILRRATIGCN